MTTPTVNVIYPYSFGAPSTNIIFPTAPAGSGSGITGLVGDVLASGAGVVAATVVSVDGSSAANVHAAEQLANAATSADTPSAIVRRDASGNLSAGTITASLSGHASSASSAPWSGITGIPADLTQFASATLDGVLSHTDWATFNSKQAALTPGTISTTTTGVTITNGTAATVGPATTINIATASGSATGLLTSTDWSTFNSKQAALTPGTISTTTTGVTIGSGASATVGPNVTVDIATASTTLTGLLTATDWNTFNNKQAALTPGSLTSSTPAVTLTNNTGMTVGPNATLNISNVSYTNSGLMAAGDKQKLDLLPLNQLTRQSHTGYPRSTQGWGVESGATFYGIAPKLIQVVGSYAYMCIANSPGFLTIYDVSDKIHPIQLSTIPLVNVYNNGPSAMYVEPTGRYVYVTMTSFNINIIDTLNKSSPVLVNVDTSQETTASAPWGLRQGTIPSTTFSPNAFGSLYDAVVSNDGHWLYTVDTGQSGANCAAGLFVFDVSNLTAPVQKWNILQAPSGGAGGPYGTVSFSPSGTFTCAPTSNNSIVMFSSTSTSDPNIPIGVKLYVNSYSGGNFKLYTATGGGGTQIIPSTTGTATLGWRPLSVALAGNTLFVVEFSNTNMASTPNNCRLILYDVTNIATTPPVYLGSVAPGTNGALYGVRCTSDGNWAYVSVSGTGYWYVINCTNKASPTTVATILTPNSTQVSSPVGLNVVGTDNRYLWVATIAGGTSVPIYLYDVSTPANPVLANQLAIQGTVSTTNSVTINAATSTFTQTAHGLGNGEAIAFSAITAGMGIVIGQQYYTVNVTTNTFQLALTIGGAPITLTGTTGTGTLYSGIGQAYAYNGFFYVANRALNTMDIYTTLAYTYAMGTATTSTLTVSDFLRLTPHSLLTTPVDGTFEYDGTHLYFTIGSTRNTLI
jgi:hypothetical protein